MKRSSWAIVPMLFIPLLLGLGLGLVYSWMISPARVFDSEPIALRADFKDQYRVAIAAAYAATGNLPRAQARLSYLGDTDPIETLNSQAQRMLASGQPFQKADQVAALASALENNDLAGSTPTPTMEAIKNIVTTPSSTLPPPPPDLPIQFTETLQILETEPAIPVSTARPTRTPIPTPGSPFKLTGQETVCDPNLPDGLLQIIVYNSNRRQAAGIEIIITWDGGKEKIFTGFKPEISNGYADFIMTPDIPYSVQPATGGDVASGLTPPTCQSSNGEAFFGGLKLTFQR